VSRLTLRRRRIYVPTANGFFRFWNWFWIVFGALVHHGPDGIRVTDNNTRDDPRRRRLTRLMICLNAFRTTENDFNDVASLRQYYRTHTYFNIRYLCMYIILYCMPYCVHLVTTWAEPVGVRSSEKKTNNRRRITFVRRENRLSKTYNGWARITHNINIIHSIIFVGIYLSELRDYIIYIFFFWNIVHGLNITNNIVELISYSM